MYWTVDLAKTYQLDLQSQRQQPIAWDNLGLKAKMHHFFGRPIWPLLIEKVSASSTGKAGVFFLYEDEPSPSYVVKLTNAPQRILFAEYVLTNFGRAKIPKSLVVSLYWDDYPDDLDNDIDLADAQTDDGLKLVHLLRQPNLRHPNVAQGSLREKTYDNNLARLDKGKPNRPNYLVIMKCFTSAPAGDPFQSTIPDPFVNVPRGRTIVYSLESKKDFGEWLEETNASWLTQIGKTASKVRFADLTANSNYVAGTRLKEIIWGILINKWILSNEDLLRKAGRVLAADTVIRNADRLQGRRHDPNFGNIFFAAKTYDPNAGKVNNPVAVIDNDALLTTYNPEDPPCDELGFPTDSLEQKAKKYLDFVLVAGQELVIDPDSRLLGVSTPGSNLSELVDDFDTRYFSSRFVGAIVPPEGHPDYDYPVLRELYSDDGQLLGRPAGTYRHFSSDPASPEWQRVRTALKSGFAEAIDDLRNKPTATKGFKDVYDHLLNEYGFDNDFDVKALKVTQYYLGKRLQVQKDALNRVTGFTAAVPHNYAVIDIKKDILHVEYGIGTWIANSFNFGLEKELIDTLERDQILKYVKYLSANDQAKFDLGLPKTKFRNYKPRLARIRVVTLALLVCFEKRVTEWLPKGLPLHLAIDSAIKHVDRLYISKIQIGAWSFYRADTDKDKQKIKVTGIADCLEILAQVSKVRIKAFYWDGLYG